jgi:hypothetical protein
MGPAELTRALDAFEARGGRAFDALECDFVRGLLTHVHALPPQAAALLLPRAAERLQRLQERFEASCRQTHERLEVAEELHGELPQLRAAVERGELSRVRRAVRRLYSTPPRARADHHSRCARAYDTAVTELLGSITVAQAVDTVPEHSGPYNSLRIATDLLACISAFSPIYLTAQLGRLEELARMLSLPAPAAPAAPPPPSKPAPRRSTKPSKRRTSH